MEDWKYVWPRIVVEYFGVTPSGCLSSSSVGHVCSPSIGSGSTSDCSDSWKAGSARASSFMSSSMAFVPSSLSYMHMYQNEGQNYEGLTLKLLLWLQILPFMKKTQKAHFHVVLFTQIPYKQFTKWTRFCLWLPFKLKKQNKQTNIEWPHTKGFLHTFCMHGCSVTL